MRLDIAKLSAKWFGVDWDQGGGRFKELVRDANWHAYEYGWLSIPGYLAEGFFLRIQHVLSWIPFLWDDYDWDYTGIWLLQREKIKRLRLCLTRNKLVCGWEKSAKEMKTAEAVLTRLIEDDYIPDEWEKHWKTFGHIEFKSLPDGSRISVRKDQKTEEESGKDIKRLAEREEYLRNQDMTFLGEHLKKHIRGWWD